jgi:hypothetical protein
VKGRRLFSRRNGRIPTFVTKYLHLLKGTFRWDLYDLIHMVRFRRVGTGFVAGVYFFTHVAAAHAVEKSLWEERRVALRSAPLYAKLLSSPSPASVGWGKIDFDGGSTSSQPPSSFLGHTVPFDLASTVLPFGAIGEVRERRRGAPVVFLVQDVHGNGGAQKNIGGLIDALASRGVTLSGVEGAWNPLSLEIYRQHPVPQAVRVVADGLRQTGHLSGAEWAGLVSTSPITMVGIESASLYQANLTAAKECLARRSTNEELLTALNRGLRKQKDIVYSVSLNAFDLHTKAYAEGQETLSDFTRYVAGLPGAQERAGPQVKAFIRAIDWENRLDFSRVQSDRRLLMEKLAEELEGRELQELLNRAVAFRAGRITNGDFFAFLRSLCTRGGFSLDRTPHFRDYLEYVGLVEGIHRKRLLTELDLWENAVGNSLARTDGEKHLLALDRDAQLLSHLLRNEMSPENWDLYQTRREFVLSLPNDLGMNASSLFHDMEDVVRPYEDFCRLAIERNSALVDNFIAQIETEKVDQSVLVAGGFHTPGLQDELAQRGYSTVVLTPRIEKVEGNPLDVFARDPLPLDQLFAGKPISLASELLLGSPQGKYFVEILMAGEAVVFAGEEPLTHWFAENGPEIKRVDQLRSGLVQITLGNGVVLFGGPEDLVSKSSVSSSKSFLLGLSNGHAVSIQDRSLGQGVWSLVGNLILTFLQNLFRFGKSSLDLVLFRSGKSIRPGHERLLSMGRLLGWAIPLPRWAKFNVIPEQDQSSESHKKNPKAGSPVESMPLVLDKRFSSQAFVALLADFENQWAAVGARPQSFVLGGVWDPQSGDIPEILDLIVCAPGTGASLWPSRFISFLSSQQSNYGIAKVETLGPVEGVRDFGFTIELMGGQVMTLVGVIGGKPFWDQLVDYVLPANGRENGEKVRRFLIGNYYWGEGAVEVSKELIQETMTLPASDPARIQLAQEIGNLSRIVRAPLSLRGP